MWVSEHWSTLFRGPYRILGTILDYFRVPCSLNLPYVGTDPFIKDVEGIWRRGCNCNQKVRGSGFGILGSM